MADAKDMLLAVAADPSDALARLALADALRDEGAAECAALEAHGSSPFSWWSNERLFFGSGIGSGIGSGSGIGRGIGRGIGGGRGIGSGRGSGGGRGGGIGSASGSGSDSGSGRGRGSEVYVMEIGKAYLVHCGDWHTVVGRVVKQVGPFTYLLGSVSKVCDTKAGDCWEKLAAGDMGLRRGAEYRHYKTQAVVPLNVLAFEWVGNTPQEDSYGG